MSDGCQNTTFFVLGLFATAVGAVGIARTGNERRGMHCELRLSEGS